MSVSRSLISLIAFAATLGTASAASAVAFQLPTSEGWRHETPLNNPDRTVDQWKLSTEIVTVVHETAGVYADQIASIRKNLNDMGSKPKVDKDVPCQGQQAHVFEFSYGPEGKIATTNRMLVPDGPSGLTTVTYTRTLDQFDPDVKKAIENFCKAPA